MHTVTLHGVVQLSRVSVDTSYVRPRALTPAESFAEAELLRGGVRTCEIEKETLRKSFDLRGIRENLYDV